MGRFLLLAVGDTNLSIFDPVSPPAQSIRSLFLLVLAITGVIFVIVEGVLIYSLIRFRRGQPNGSEPPQVYGSMPIEIAWTAAPALIVVLLVLILARTEYEVALVPAQFPDNARPLFVTVIGHQWWWEYVYERYEGEDLGFVTANELHVPLSTEVDRRPVYLTLKSADVCHSFWVPRLAGKMDLIPGRTNHLYFEPNKTPGLFLGQCAEYCGTQHANMLLRVYVESPEDFATWLKKQKKPAVDDPKVRAGRDIFLGQTCINCHRVRGTVAKGTVGPDLTHLMSRQTLASGMIPVEKLREWVTDPQRIKPGCLMAAFALEKKDMNALVEYLQTLE